jgi:hypothetical protein
MTHRIMKMVASYVSTTYQIWPTGMDLEGALFEIDNALCPKIVKDALLFCKATLTERVTPCPGFKFRPGTTTSDMSLGLISPMGLCIR